MNLRNLLSKLLFKPEAQKGSGFYMPPPRTLSSFNPSPVAWADDNDIIDWRYANAYRTHEGIYSIVSMLAQKFASFPVYVYEIKDQKAFQKYKNIDPRTVLSGNNLERSLILRNQAIEIVVENDLSKLLQEPNSDQSLNELLELYYGYKLIYGEGNLYLNSGGSPKLKPVEMYVIPPPMMGVVRDETNNFGIGGYYLAKNGVPYKPVDKENMIQWKYFNPVFDKDEMMHLRGLSPLTAAMTVLEQSVSAQKASSAMYNNGGAKGALFGKNLPRTMTKEQVDTMIQQINERVNNTSQKAAISALNGDWGYHDFGMSSIDMGLLDAQRLSLQRLCNIYGVPTVLFDAEHTTYNNYESAIKQLIVNKLLPEWTSLRTLLNRKLTSRFANTNGKSKLFIDFDFTELPELQKDLKDLNDSVRDAHWLSYNETRAVGRYGARPEKEMDMIIIPTGYIPIQDMGVFNEQSKPDQETDQENDQ